jgi:hypothetical protein
MAVGSNRVAAFALTVLTHHETGIVRVVPYSLHVAIDFWVGRVFVVRPDFKQ